MKICDTSVLIDINLHDVYIAATARTRDLPVLTANVDHFDRTDDPRVVDWETF